MYRIALALLPALFTTGATELGQRAMPIPEAHLYSAPEAHDARGLIAAEAIRRHAIMANNLGILENLTSDTFHYAHINGLVEDRAAYFKRMASAGGQIIKTSASDMHVTFRPGYALLNGRSHIEVAPAGIAVDTLFLSVWEYRRGKWKITAYASTPLPTS